MAICRHFPNREALLKRLADGSFNTVAGGWETRATHRDASKHLLALLEPHLDYAPEHPHLYDRAFPARGDDARRVPGDFRSRSSPTLNVVAAAVAEGMRLGVQDAPWDVAMSLRAHAQGLIALDAPVATRHDSASSTPDRRGD